MESNYKDAAAKIEAESTAATAETAAAPAAATAAAPETAPAPAPAPETAPAPATETAPAAQTDLNLGVENAIELIKAYIIRRQTHEGEHNDNDISVTDRKKLCDILADVNSKWEDAYNGFKDMVCEDETTVSEGGESGGGESGGGESGGGESGGESENSNQSGGFKYNSSIKSLKKKKKKKNKSAKKRERKET